ncbi:MAG: DUF937 domain-containing protein [Lutimonas sp.]
MKLLSSDQGKQLVSGVSSQMGMKPQDATSALGAAMPLILGAMKNNASSEAGTQNLLGALGDSRHSSGSLLENIGSILGGDSIDADTIAEGGKILGHVFGGQENNAAGAVSKASGLNMDSAMNLLKIAAPFIMSYLGQRTSKAGVQDQAGIDDLLGGLLGSQGSDIQSMASQIQGFDNNDSSIEDIADALSQSLGGSKGGLGGLLGGLLK